MESKIEELPKSKVKATIKLPYPEFKKYVDIAFKILSKDVDIKGFRSGKAPRRMLEEKIGKDRIFQEALEKAIPETLSKALAKEEYLALGTPKISMGKYPQEDKDDEYLEYVAEVEVMPKLKVPDYKEMKVKRVEAEKVTEKETDEVFNNLRQSHATYEKVERGVENGDRIEVDFTGKIGGVKIDKLTSKNHPFILGKGYFIPEFEKQVLGLKEGEEKKFQVKIDEKIPDPDITGRVVDFEVKIQSVQKVIFPELNDEFAKKFNKKSLQELREELKKSLTNQKELQAKQKSQNKILETLASKTDVEIPEVLVEREKDRILQSLKQDIEMRGLSFGDYLNSIKKTEIELKDDLIKQATDSVKIALIINKVREQEKLQVNRDEVDGEFEMLKKSGQPIDSSLKVKNQVASRILSRKTILKLEEYMIE